MRINTLTCPAFRLRSLAVATVSVLSACGNTTALQSQQIDRLVTVDGVEDEWTEAIVPLDSENLSIGVSNDDEYLYLVLVSEDRGVVMQATALGLTIWFDPAGGKEHSFGIQYPMGLLFGIRPDLAVGGPVDPQVRQDHIDASLGELHLLLGEDESIRSPVGAIKGISTNIQTDGDRLVYELKVPLQGSEDFEYAIGAEPGATLGISLETGEFNFEDVRGSRGGNGAGRGGAGGGVGRGPRGASSPKGGGGAGRSSGRRPSGQGRPEPVKAWVQVELVATGP
jgi:hypothetical protein